jgi:pyruvate dehydrogenase phosphatase
MGYPKVAYVGSCALVAIVKDNKLYVANAGDSKGVLLRRKDDDTFEYIKVSKTFNANKTYEQERLKNQFKKEDDIVVCKRDDYKACYVKGNLMPTRAFGDLRLKHSEFNFHNHPPELGYRKPIPTYNGPYITHEPEITVIDLQKNDQYLILASDGLWDEISRKKSAELVKSNETDLKKVAGT